MSPVVTHRMFARYRRGGLAALAMLAMPVATAAQTPTAVRVDADGTIHSDGLSVPLSTFLSPAAKAMMATRLAQAAYPNATRATALVSRQATDQAMRALLAKWLAVAPSTITPETIGGVQTDVVVPEGGVAPENVRRVLINLHGGGFFAGARAGGQVEAVPLSARGRIKVITVDYRMAPEAQFPAASEDVERVYRALLKTYKPENIGIYGCSAGGTLVAQSLAWFQTHKLPRPGAAGIFCSGAMPSFWYGGDSYAIGQMMNGQPAATPKEVRENAGNLYLEGIDQNNPLIAPALFPAVLARFPPTLILTSTRDSAMSNALVTNMNMLEAGAETQLLVLEGVGHGEFIGLVGTPETRQAYDMIWRFFDKHLGH